MMLAKKFLEAKFKIENVVKGKKAGSEFFNLMKLE